MPVISCEHDEETDLADCSVRGGIVHWDCGQGEHEAAVSEL